MKTESFKFRDRLNHPGNGDEPRGSWMDYCLQRPVIVDTTAVQKAVRLHIHAIVSCDISSRMSLRPAYTEGHDGPLRCVLYHYRKRAQSLCTGGTREAQLLHFASIARIVRKHNRNAMFGEVFFYHRGLPNTGGDHQQDT